MDESVDVGALFVPWAPAVPPAPIVAVPAASVVELAGRRVVAGLPDRGWHVDLRVIGGPRVHGRRTVVDVAPEWEFYRSRLISTLVDAPDVPAAALQRLQPPPIAAYPLPIDWVWVETPLNRPEPDAAARVAQPVQPARPETVLDRVASMDAPAARVPVPARDMPLLTGRRLVIATPDGDWRDVRATSEPHERDGGGLYVLVCPEELWYRWSLTGERIHPTAVPLHLVWAE